MARHRTPTPASASDARLHEIEAELLENAAAMPYHVYDDQSLTQYAVNDPTMEDNLRGIVSNFESAYAAVRRRIELFRERHALYQSLSAAA